MQKHFGTIAIIGRPNVGKSTLMNFILGEKISITSNKPQTTRNRILGIKTTDSVQMVFIDTPGLHHYHKHEMNRIMNRAARDTIAEVDVVLFLIEAMRWNEDDALVLKQLQSLDIPVLLVINKVDMIKNKLELLPFMENLAKQYDFAKIIPLSAKSGLQVDELEKTLESLMPHEGEMYPEDQLTDRGDRFIAAEFMREKLMRSLGSEIPYELAVTVELMEEEEAIIKISLVIWIARESQKSIVIGKHGSVLKQAGTQARKDLEYYFQKKVLLKSWVKVRENWSDDQRSMVDLGIDES